jgi:hypothetical protein
MASTVTTTIGGVVNPITTGGLFTPNSGTQSTAVSDSSDATWVEHANLALGVLGYNIPTPTLPAGSVLQFFGVQVRRAVSAGANNVNPFYLYQMYGLDAAGTQHSSTFAPSFTPSMAFNTSIQQHTTGPITNFSSGLSVNDMNKSVLLLVFGVYPAGVAATFLRLYHIEVNWYYNSAPIITIPTLPANPSSSSKPMTAWTYSDTESDPQRSARLIVVPDGQASAAAPFGPPGSAGYVPQGVSPLNGTVYDSGTVFTATQQLQCLSALSNGSTYWSYVQVAQDPDAGRAITSAWVGRQFLVTLTAPANPTLAVAVNNALAKTTLTVEENSAHATPHAARFDIQRSDDAQVSWTPVRGADQASTARGWRNAGTASNGWTTPDNAAFTFQNGIDIRWFGALDDYTPAAIQTMASHALSTGSQQSWVFKLLTTGVLRLARSTTGTGAYINHDSTTSVGTADGTDIGFRVVAVFNVNPITINFYRSIDNGANWIAVGTQVTAAGPSTIVNSTANLNVGGYENLTLEPLNGLTRRVEYRNSAGVLVANPTFESQQYTVGPANFVDNEVNTWTRVGSTAYMQMGLTVDDNEAPLGTAVRYRARAWKDDGTDQAAGSWVLDSAGPYTISPTSWRLKDPLVPASNVSVSVVACQPERIKPQIVTQGIGASVATVTHSGLRGYQIDVTFRTDGRAAHNALMALFESGHTLLLQSVLGEQWYVQLGERLQIPIIKAAPAVGETTPIRFLREFGLMFNEVEAP